MRESLDVSVTEEAHLWNNELHYEEIPHCEKLIVNNEPL